MWTSWFNDVAGNEPLVCAFHLSVSEDAAVCSPHLFPSPPPCMQTQTTPLHRKRPRCLATPCQVAQGAVTRPSASAVITAHVCKCMFLGHTRCVCVCVLLYCSFPVKPYLNWTHWNTLRDGENIKRRLRSSAVFMLYLTAVCLFRLFGKSTHKNVRWTYQLL